jgi:pyruvate/2-oxoacid:ferredoxin oxidoreductase alpha subunit
MAVDQLREKGYKTGAIGLRVFRPFPEEALAQALSGAEHLVIFDKNISYGYEGATCTETKAALFGSGLRPVITNYIVGLGGKNVNSEDLVGATLDALKQKEQRNGPRWLGVAV